MSIARILLVAAFVFAAVSATAQVTVAINPNGYIDGYTVCYAATGTAVGSGASVLLEAGVLYEVKAMSNLSLGTFEIVDHGDSYSVVSSSNNFFKDSVNTTSPTLKFVTEELFIKLNGYQGGYELGYEYKGQRSSYILPLEFSGETLKTPGNNFSLSRDAQGEVTVGSTRVVGGLNTVTFDVLTIPYVTSTNWTGVMVPFALSGGDNLGKAAELQAGFGTAYLIPGTYMVYNYDMLGGPLGGSFNGTGTFVVTDDADWGHTVIYTLKGVNYKLLLGSHVPEPATMSLLSLGGLALLRRRRK